MSTAPFGYMKLPPTHSPSRARTALRLTYTTHRPRTDSPSHLHSSLATVDRWCILSGVIYLLLSANLRLSPHLLLHLYDLSLCLVCSLTLDAPRRSRPLATAPMTLIMATRTTGMATTVLIMNLEFNNRRGLPGARCCRRVQARALTPRPRVRGLAEECVRVASSCYMY